MTDAELYQQYLSETGKQPAQTGPVSAKPSEAELYQQYLSEKDGHQENATTTQAPKTSATEAAVGHFGNSASFGYLPQIQAATGPAIQSVLSKFLPDDPQGFNVQETRPQSYTERRDQASRELEQQQKEHPGAAIGGDIAGSLASGIATGGGISKILGTAGQSASFLGRAGQAAKAGALVGAIRNPGDAEGEVSPFQVGDRAINTLKDAATGAIIHGAFEGAGKVGKFIRNAPEELASFAENRALNATGAGKRDFKLLDKLGTKSSVAKTAIHEGIISAGDSVHDVAEKVVAKKNEIGKNIGDIYKQAGDELKNNPHIDSEINLHKALDEFKSDITKKYTGDADGDEVINKLVKKIDSLKNNPQDITLDELQKIRQSVDKSAKKAGAFGPNQDTDVAKELKNLRNKLQDMASDKISEVDQLLGTNYVNDLKGQNKLYSNIKSIEGIAKEGLSKAEANRIFGASEQIAATAGYVKDGLSGALPLSIGARLVKKYGDSTAAVAANKASQTLAKNPAIGQALGYLPEKFSRINPLVTGSSSGLFSSTKFERKNKND